MFDLCSGKSEETRVAGAEGQEMRTERGQESWRALWALGSTLAFLWVKQERQEALEHRRDMS